MATMEAPVVLAEHKALELAVELTVEQMVE